VKTLSADGSVGSPHVRVGHRQDLYSKKAAPGFRVRLFFAQPALAVKTGWGFFLGGAQCRFVLMAVFIA
jgi:hypothetical protein